MDEEISFDDVPTSGEIPDIDDIDFDEDFSFEDNTSEEEGFVTAPPVDDDIDFDALDDAPSEESVEEDVEEDEPEKKARLRKKKSKRKPSTMRFIKAFFLTVFFYYKKLANFIIKIIEFPLKFVAQIPIIGRGARLGLYVTRLLKKVVPIVPVLFFGALFVVFFAIGGSGNVVDLPDEAQVTIKTVSFQGETAIMTVHNTGDVDVEVVPTVDQYNVLTGLKFWYQESGSCTTDDVYEIPIGGKMDISLSCPDLSNGNGLLTRYYGELM